MGSLMIEENVVSQAGTVYHLSVDTLRKCISEAGYIPRQRNVYYEYIDDEDAFKGIKNADPKVLPILGS